jgi:putative sigma-54 modulation protein
MMQLDIQTNGFSLTDAIRNYTTQRMQFALDRDDGQIMYVRVSLVDINGPRGGIDKRCLINLALAGKNNIVVEDTEADLYVAIDRASDRCERTLTRRLERMREFSHDAVHAVEESVSDNRLN